MILLNHELLRAATLAVELLAMFVAGGLFGAVVTWAAHRRERRRIRRADRRLVTVGVAYLDGYIDGEHCGYMRGINSGSPKSDA